ncbi:BatD family protein [Xanthobacter variabilis]|uniref:BatD family protein n=1 Tax=Xanthobacter variabilis TaxID=3119932 RepID=UPI0037262B9B
MKGAPAALAGLLARTLLAFALLSAAVPATAQPGAPPPAAPEQATPQPMVRATLTPAQVVVGQAATLVVEVLAPNYMTKPPVLPDFQVANAITRVGPTMNFSERQADATYAGIRYTLLITPQEPGAYAMTGQAITLTYANDPPKTRVAKVAVPAAHFEAIIPAAAHALHPFISAAGLSLSQDVQRSSPALKIGDSVTRVVTIQAEGTPAILLPPTSFAPIAGTRVYPGQPELSEGVDENSGVLKSTRTDRAVYMLEGAGTLTLPSIEVAWWDVAAEKIQHARLEPQTFAVAGDASTLGGALPHGGLSAPRRALLAILEHWPLLILAIGGTAALVWLTPPVVRSLGHRVRHLRETYRQSEAFAFRELSRIAAGDDPREIYRAFLLWLSRFEPAAPERTVKALNSWAGDRILAQEIAALERQLFAAEPEASRWSGASLLQAIKSTRRKAKLQHPNRTRTYSLPGDINPELPNAVHQGVSRPVAR